MKRIYKYDTFNVPTEAIIVHFGIDPKTGFRCVWAEVYDDIKNPYHYKSLEVVGTGYIIEDKWKHISTCIESDGCVWHLYQEN